MTEAAHDSPDLAAELRDIIARASGGTVSHETARRLLTTITQAVDAELTADSENTGG